MKKKILSIAFVLVSAITFAQLNSSGDGFLLDYTDANSVCVINHGFPNNGGIMCWGGNFVQNFDALQSAGLGLQLISTTTIENYPSQMIYYPLPTVLLGENYYTEDCSNLYHADMGVDMSNHSRMMIDIVSDTDNSEIFIYLGGEGQWHPETSSGNTGNSDSIIAKITIPKANVRTTFSLDFNLLNTIVWNQWAGKSKIQSVGFRSNTASAVFNIYKIAFGNQSICHHIQPSWYVNGTPTFFTLPSTLNVNEGDSVKFIAGKALTKDNSDFEKPLNGLFQWQYMSKNTSWQTVNTLSGVHVNDNEFKIDSVYDLHAKSGSNQTKFRYIVNYDTTQNSSDCPELIDTIELSDIIINCKPLVTSDTTTFIVTDVQFQYLQDEVYLKNERKYSFGDCDSTHYSFYRYKYGTKVNDTCIVTNTITVHDTIVHTMCDSAIVTIYDTTQVTVAGLVKVTDTLEIYLSSIISTVFDASQAVTTLKVYPNPTDENLTVSIDNYTNLSGVTIKVLDASGTIVHQQLITGSTQSIDVSSWSAGIYFLEVLNGTDIVDIRKIVVNN